MEVILGGITEYLINQEDFFEQYYDFWQRLVPQEQKEQLFQPAVLEAIDLGRQEMFLNGCLLSTKT